MVERAAVTKDDIASLVSLVGRSGAMHALAGSDTVTASELRELGRLLGLAISKQPKRQLAELLVRAADKRITRPLEELEALSRDELAEYLNATGCDAEELKALLAEADIPVQGGMSRRSLLEFAAIQVSSLGMYKRISSSDSSGRICSSTENREVGSGQQRHKPPEPSAIVDSP
ncbi:MAG: hypothetical protein OXF68_04190 [Gammaproteobacteria bacterium]|nr:hypothetical protein [Gammaproteobacteria bacterium]